MVVHNFNLGRARRSPAKTDPELIVHPDAVLALTVTPQRFETVAGRYAEIVDPAGDLQLPQLAPRDGLDVHEPSHPPAVGEGLGVSALEGDDHEMIVTLRVMNVKRDELKV